MTAGLARKAGFSSRRRKRRWSAPAWKEELGLFAPHPWSRWEPDGFPGERCSGDDERAIAASDAVIDLVGAFFNIPTTELRRTGRSELEVSRVRQIAMYVTHVVLRLTMQQVGTGFQRDRTTVLHACHMVEDLRDDIDFDRIVGQVERIVAVAFQVRRIA